jgi:predicted acetyltransferase
MPPEVRTLRGEEELAAACRLDWTAFGIVAGEVEMELAMPVLEEGRTLGGFLDDGVMAGTARAWSSELTLPGGATPRAGAITGVAVLPSHRRRGLMRALMTRLLADVRERGEPLAILTASEGGIYRRFGFGPATDAWTLEIERAHAAPAPDGPPPPVRLVEAEEAAALLPAIWDRTRRTRPGEVARTEGVWRSEMLDPPDHREGRSARFHAVLEGPGREPAGFARYRISPGWEHGVPSGRLEVEELVAEDDPGRLALWRFLAGVDLVRVIRLVNAPRDEPVRLVLRDPRRLRTVQGGDFLWVRVMDPAEALGARRYAVEGRLVLDLADRDVPDAAGVWTVEGGPGGAACRRTPGAAADLALGPSELGAALLGGVRPSTLARAGRIAERSPGALRRADAMLASDRAPWCATEF